ncbi:MAG: hypothetical protein ACJ8BW_00800, partial [Ktedonobacteraceae bacterium]
MFLATAVAYDVSDILNRTLLHFSSFEKGQAHMGIATMIGASIKRREDPRLITGQATYVDD